MLSALPDSAADVGQIVAGVARRHPSFKVPAGLLKTGKTYAAHHHRHRRAPRTIRTSPSAPACPSIRPTRSPTPSRLERAHEPNLSEIDFNPRRRGLRRLRRHRFADAAPPSSPSPSHRRGGTVVSGETLQFTAAVTGSSKHRGGLVRPGGRRRVDHRGGALYNGPPASRAPITSVATLVGRHPRRAPARRSR